MYELNWTWFGRKIWLVGIAFNLVIALAWTWYTDYRVDGIVRANAVAGIVGFVLSDPINTNQLGPEADRVVQFLRADVSLTRILLIKNMTLATVLVPLVIVLSLVLRLILGQQGSVPGDILHEVWVVVGWIALGNLASIWAPYRPFSFKRRFAMPSTWAWWAFVLVLPYLMYFMWAFGLNPVVRGIVSLFTSGRTSTNWVVGFIQAVIGIVLVLIAYRICAVYGRRKADRLERDLLKMR